jgi:anti-sigma regulatory factor (Ser/Thr protein kinase)
VPAVQPVPRGATVTGVRLDVMDRPWLQVHEAATAPAVRRAAVRLGEELALPERVLGDLAIVAAEVATNLGRHADDGAVLLRARRVGDEAGVEIVAVDRGPGMADVDWLMRDGMTTAGTLGIGLGAVRRLSTRLALHSVPGGGTVLAAALGPPAAFTPDWVSGVSRPITGEAVCGDGYAAREFDGYRQVLLCDGLGHGGLAEVAARALVAAFLAAPHRRPGDLLEYLHERIGHTRGAVAGIAELDLQSESVIFAGIGNITACVLEGTVRRNLVSLPGILGHHRRDVREFTTPMPPGALLILHSDGVSDCWDLRTYPGLYAQPPVVVAATLLRDAGKRRDDAAVLVARA